MAGVPEVSRRLFDPNDETFKAYRRPIAQDRPTTLSEAVEIAKQYILACSSPLAMELNPQICKTIGGRILIATITYQGGFKWLEGHAPSGGQASSSSKSQT
jgi:hypothetical protein